MKFAAILIGAVIAFETEADVQAKIGQIIQRNQLTAQKAELLKSLDSIDTQLEAATPAANTTATPATKVAKKEKTAWYWYVLGGVGNFIISMLCYFCVYSKSSKEGGSDDQYQKFISEMELNA